MRFEIWLLGNTITVQKKYWDLLKASEWNKDKTEMPKYSILEAVLISNPDFDNLEKLSKKIEKELIQASDDVIASIKSLN